MTSPAFMYARNIPTIKGQELAPFLKIMDDKEERDGVAANLAHQVLMENNFPEAVSDGFYATSVVAFVGAPLVTVASTLTNPLGVGICLTGLLAASVAVGAREVSRAGRNVEEVNKRIIKKTDALSRRILQLETDKEDMKEEFKKQLYEAQEYFNYYKNNKLAIGYKI